MKRLFSWCRGLALLGLLLAVAPSPADPKDEEKVELKVVKYDELTKLIADQKGKVIVVDFWADT